MKTNTHTKKTLPAILTLMYHRIDTIDTNPWGICVSPQNFEKQISFLHDNYKVISIDEAVKQISESRIEENCVCITFDDGYADNYFHAKPILEKYNCAATFFIATAFINTKSFWWDKLEIIFLHSKQLPKELSIQTGDEKLSFRLSENKLTEQEWEQHKTWKWHEAPPTDRCKIYLSLWEKLTALSPEKIEAALIELRHWSCYDIINYPQRLPMNNAQLKEFSANKLFTLALHTHNHCDLSYLNEQSQHNEITTCKEILHDQIGIKSNYFSYPFGKYNDDTIQLAKDLQLSACFTTEAIVNNSQSDKFLLGRFQPFNWDNITFKKHLDDWFANAITIAN